MNNLSLDSRNWDTFFIEDVAEILSGRDIYEKERLDGLIPYITATANNNGIGYFVANNNETLESNCLSVNRNGSVGYCFYHPYKALYGNDTRKLRLKKNNKYISLFISICITKQREKYGYGYKMGTGRLKRQRILLPIDANNDPDWQFMENYMKAKEQQILKSAIKTLRKHLIINDITQKRLVKWKSFEFTEIFIIKNGFYNKKPPCYDFGNIPFIGASDSNNGFTGFTTKEIIDSNSKTGYGKNEPLERKIFPANAICVTNNGSVGYAYYQQHEFTCTHDVNPLYLKNHTLNKYIAMFIIRCIEQQKVCFAYARKWRPKRMVKSRLLLPVNEKGNPDWKYMENYMMNIESKKIINYFKILGLLQ